MIFHFEGYLDLPASEVKPIFNKISTKMSNMGKLRSLYVTLYQQLGTTREDSTDVEIKTEANVPLMRVHREKV